MPYKRTQDRISQDKSRYNIRKKAGLCVRCGKPTPGRRCKECSAIHKIATDKHYKKLKDQVYAAYGGYKCSCCGETEPSFLTLDHINNDGNQYRRDVGGTFAQY